MNKNLVARGADLPAIAPGLDVETLLAGHLAPSSIAMYRRDVAAYQEYASKAGLDALDARSLAAWRDSLALDSDPETQLSPNTINRQLAAVKRIIKQASTRGIISEAAALAFKQVDGVQVRALKSRLKKDNRTRITPEDMRQLCDAPDPASLLGLRDRALLACLASSGIRASEAASLTIGQIARQGRGYILRVCGKTDIDYRDAHLSAEAYSRIMEWIAARPILSQSIFTSFAGRGSRATAEPMSETSVWRAVQRYAIAAGLDHIKPHDFRRFVGTELAAVDIRKAQLALGHASIQTTAKHYVLDRLRAGETDNLY